MANTLEIVRGISQALANKHDGAIDEEGNPIVEIQDAALLALEQGSSFTPLTFEEAMIQSRLLHKEEEE